MGKNKSIMVNHIAEIIVDRRNLLFLIYIIGILFSLYSMTLVEVENDITYYLDESTKTRQGIEIMNKEFITLGMADIMISNISYDHAKTIADDIVTIDGVSTVMFENTEEHYKDSSALMVILFSGEEADELVLSSMNEIRDLVAKYDSAIYTTVGVDEAAQLTKDMTIVGVLASIIAFIVLLFTSKSYAEIPVLIITFGVAAILNLGTNHLLGKISFISNSVAVVLQLALAIDYAIILCHRFTEEYEIYSPTDAAKIALSKAIPEISSSSLTTIAGLGALAFMQFGIGKDLAMVMIKAIFLSMLTVFTLMPGLLVLFSRMINKTKHPNFIQSVEFLGRFSIKTRFVMPPIFIVMLIVSFVLFNKCPFLFSMSDIRAHNISDVQRDKDRISDTFGRKNMAALILPSGNYESEKKLISNLEKYDEVNTIAGLSNTEAIGGYMLTDKLTPRQFSELVDLDYEIAQVLYSAYAINKENYSEIISGIGQYGVALIDMYPFLYEEVVKGYINLDDKSMEDLSMFNEQLSIARKQMEGEHYTRILLYLNLPEESDETFNFMDKIYEESAKYYKRDSVFVVGESSNALDLSLSFDTDNLIISVLSVLFVIIILTFTFQSAGLPILLISVIQASIWINFSFPYIRGEGLYFLGFLVVSSIQMGANIDYAIVITSRYLYLRKEKPKYEAIIHAVSQSFPTVITSGTILAVAGILIGRFSTDGATSVLGTYLGQGTIISIILVLFVLPQLLYLGDSMIEKTSFRIKKEEMEVKL